MSLLQAGFTNHAFSCELYLKSLYLLEKNDTNEKHDLDLLFYSLTPFAQDRITSLYNSVSDNRPDKLLIRRQLGDLTDYTIKAILKEASKAYIWFRYYYERKSRPKPGTSRSYRLGLVIWAIRKYIHEIKPEWPILNEIEEI